MFSENLKTQRKAKGFFQEQLATRLNIVRQAVTKWESNISNPSSDNLIKLAELLGVSIDVLLGNCEYGDTGKSESVINGKAPWGLIGISIACVIAYIVVFTYLFFECN